MDETLKKYLLWRFHYFNHAKYRNLADEWIANITIDQLQYAKRERENLIKNNIYKP